MTITDEMKQAVVAAFEAMAAENGDHFRRMEDDEFQYDGWLTAEKIIVAVTAAMHPSL